MRFNRRKIFQKVLKFRTEVSIVDSEVSMFMKTESTLSTVPRQDSSSVARVTRPRSVQPRPPFERRRSHEADLAATPGVRASEVARGRALIASLNYPSREQLKKIARVLLANGLSR